MVQANALIIDLNMPIYGHFAFKAQYLLYYGVYVMTLVIPLYETIILATKWTYWIFNALTQACPYKENLPLKPNISITVCPRQEFLFYMTLLTTNSQHFEFSRVNPMITLE